MVGQNDTPKRLASLLDEVAVHEGTHQTLVEGVQVTRVSRPMHRTPVVYQPKIAVVGRGRKRGYLGDEVYTYDPFNYLVLSVPLSAECEWEASPEEPVLLVAINVEPTMLGEMILEMDEPLPPVDTTPRGISTTPMSEELGGASSDSSSASSARSTAACSAARRSERSSTACSAASKAGRSVPWPAGTSTSPESLGS